MKKALIASVLVCSLTLIALPVFAQRGRQNMPMHNGGHWNNNMRSGGHMGGYCGDYGWGNRDINGASTVKMGTIASVDVKNNSFTITDADGKNLKISVNPTTSFTETSEIIAQRNMRRANPNEWTQTNVTPKVLSFSELKAGDWVTIRSFNTGTTTIDAANVQVVQKK